MKSIHPVHAGLLLWLLGFMLECYSLYRQIRSTELRTLLWAANPDFYPSLGK
ncbi:hypothetical protein [Spirosoma litoris]